LEIEQRRYIILPRLHSASGAESFIVAFEIAKRKLWKIVEIFGKFCKRISNFAKDDNNT